MKLFFIKEILAFIFHTLTTKSMRIWMAKQATGYTKWEWDDAAVGVYEAYEEKDYEKAQAAIKEARGDQ